MSLHAVVCVANGWQFVKIKPHSCSWRIDSEDTFLYPTDMANVLWPHINIHLWCSVQYPEVSISPSNWNKPSILSGDFGASTGC